MLHGINGGFDCDISPIILDIQVLGSYFDHVQFGFSPKKLNTAAHLLANLNYPLLLVTIAFFTPALAPPRKEKHGSTLGKEMYGLQNPFYMPILNLYFECQHQSETTQNNINKKEQKTKQNNRAGI